MDRLSRITLGFAGWVTLGVAFAAPPMPPSFDLDSHPEELLSDYPLGVITGQIAFSHHGGPHRKIALPNEHEGWVYNVGEKEWHRTYTLVIDSNQTVSDVLYFDHTRFDAGLSAMLLQSRPRVVGGSRFGPGPQ